MSQLKWLGLSGSLRKASTNTGLLRAAQNHLPEGVTMDILELSTLPFYNQDIAYDQWPANCKEVVQKIADADGLVLACPEYNYSIAPVLKNAIDWASRVPGNTSLDKKPVVILGSGGGMGTSRAQYHLRQVMVCVNAFPMTKPEFFSNAFSDSFNENGDLVGVPLIKQLETLLVHFKQWCNQLSLP